MNNMNIKAKRVFSPLRKYAWIFTLLVGIGGLWFPKLGLLVILIILSLTLVAFFKGRYWCGNFCPHGSLFDHLMLPISWNKKIPAFLRSRIFAYLFLAFFAFNISRRLIKVFAIYGATPFWDKLGYVFVVTYLMVIVVGGLLSFLVAPRTWCQFCPMGTMQIWSYKLGKFLGINKKTDSKISVTSATMCHSCGKCSRVCPMQLSPYLAFSDQNQFDHEACIRCSTCVYNCPAGILTLQNEAKALEITKDTDLTGYDARQKIQARLENINNLTDDVAEYTFTFKHPERVHYQAGQFILVKIQDHPKMYRAYSISSYDKDGTSLSVTIKKVPGGYGSEIIAENFRLGDLVELDGPMGHELIVDKDHANVLLIAGGIGITPFRAILMDLMQNSHQITNVQLVYGVNTGGEFLYDDAFRSFESQDDRFKYLPVVAADENWSGKKGFVTDLIKDMNLEGYKIYMCGPKPMIEATLKTLKSMGVSSENIFFESA